MGLFPNNVKTPAHGTDVVHSVNEGADHNHGASDAADDGAHIGLDNGVGESEGAVDNDGADVVEGLLDEKGGF